VKQEGAVGSLLVALECPKCGAPFAVDDAAVTHECAHCASLLLLAAPARDEIFLADGQIRSDQDILDLVIRYRVESQRAEILARFEDSEGNRNPPPEIVIEELLRAYEAQLRARAHISEARRFHAPYWHITGAIVQAILGRYHDGPKRVTLRAFAVEHTVPGYDVHAANLRDRGLRLARSGVRPLRVRDVVELGAFLPAQAVPDQQYREIDKWRLRDLEPELEPVTKTGAFLGARRVLVYRPYWLARVFLDTAQEWVLVDGSFATLAGHPGELEARALLASGVADPLRSQGESFRHVHVVASRCPDCGWEMTLAGREHVVICPNCHLALAPEPKRVCVVAHDHACHGDVPPGGAFVPFWRFTFSLEPHAAAAVDTLEAYAQVLHPRGAPPGFAPKGRQLWIPAVRLLGTRAGDEAFKDSVEWIHAADLDLRSGKVPLGGTPRLAGVSLSEAEARALGPFVLFGLHGETSAARLNVLLWRKAIQDVRLTLGAARLVWVAGAPIPQPLLAGGPVLDAQRETVHRRLGV
jgi:predicted RNA-binding Zn-ribbon protein involved in translation (DUF1610 family)